MASSGFAVTTDPAGLPGTIHATAGEIERRGGRARAVRCDVGRADDSRPGDATAIAAVEKTRLAYVVTGVPGDDAVSRAGRCHTLKRRLGLPLLVLYGTGITIGAGIYVLVGAVAGYAGVYTPWSFFLAAAIMALTMASYIELSTRLPVSAGEAAYVKAAFESRLLSILVGLLTIGIATVSSAAVALGSAGYIQQFLYWPRDVIVMVVVALLGAVAVWGILESVVLASLFTVIEVGGLVAIIAMGFYSGIPIAAVLTNVPPMEATASSHSYVSVPIWVPALGAVACIVMIAGSLLR